MSPDYESRPGKKWTQIVARVSKSPWLHNGYCEPGGFMPFRKNIADYVRRTRGIVCDPEDVIVTNGIQQGLTFCAELLFNPGDACFVEEPGFQPHRDALQFFGIETRPLQAESERMVSDLRTPGTPPRGMLVTPSHQYPLGKVMPVETRAKIVEWAAETGAWVIEDDYDGELRYGGAPYPALASIDQNRESVIYLGSFTKIIYPGFNLGYLIAPKSIARLFEGEKLLNDRHASEVHQVILSEFIESGEYEAHTRRLKRLYEDRRETLITGVASRLGHLGHVVPGNQGTHLTFIFDSPIDEVKLTDFMRNRFRLEIRPLSPCYQTARKLSGMILGFAGFSSEVIAESIVSLANGVELFFRSNNFLDS